MSRAASAKNAVIRPTETGKVYKLKTSQARALRSCIETAAQLKQAISEASARLNQLLTAEQENGQEQEGILAEIAEEQDATVEELNGCQFNGKELFRG